VRGERRSRGSLEQSVIEVLAATGMPLTPAAVRDRLGTGLAYTTVMTVLTRLADKGQVLRERAGRGYAYRVISDETEVTARRMQRLLGSQEDRATVLAHFVSALEPGDEAVLADLLAQASAPPERAG
jgi:predicted transcriptional regulator